MFSSPSFYVLFLLQGCLSFFCSYQAFKRGKNPIVWFLVGILCGLIGLGILYFFQFALQAKQKKAPHPSSTVDESTRHEEKENNAFLLWHYLGREKKAEGPMSFQALEEAWQKKRIDSSTYVWNETMVDWERIYQIPHLMNKLGDLS